MSKPQAQFAEGTLFVVEDQCQFAADRSRGTVVIESTADSFPTAIDELRDAKARNLAIAYAASEVGMGDPRINGNLIGPYAVNSQGTPLDKVMETNANDPLPANHALMQPVAYRVEVPVTRAMR